MVYCDGQFIFVFTKIREQFQLESKKQEVRTSGIGDIAHLENQRVTMTRN